jgi:hypothetical protein
VEAWHKFDFGRKSLRLDRRVSQLLGRHLNHLIIAPDIERTPLSHMQFDYLLNSCFEGHFSAFRQGAIREYLLAV